MGLDLLFGGMTYSVVGSAGGWTPNGDSGFGNDTLFGGNHADAFNGLGGSDTVDYSRAGTAVTASLTNQASNIGTAAAGDSYTGIENLRGSAFVDTLIGNGSDNVLEGGASADSLQGGGGSDTASYEHAPATSGQTGVTASLISPTTNTGDAAGDSYTSIENLRGSAFNDTLTGNGGDNVIEGGAGNDALNGGAGNNTVSYEHATGSVFVDLGSGSATGAAGQDALSNFVYVKGSQFSDLLTGDGNNNTFIGLGGDDTFAFKSNFGNDTITDFAPGQDHIAFDFDPTAFSGPSPGPLETWLGSHLVASGNDTLLTLDDPSHSSILFKNVSVANLHASDFIVSSGQTG
jgi:Ca2+-binding RTX toxin-like protein